MWKYTAINDNGRRACILVESIQQYHWIGTARPESTFSLLCLTLVVLVVFNPAWGHNPNLISCQIIVFTMAMIGGAFILAESMGRSRWPMTNSMYVCMPVCLTLVALLPSVRSKFNHYALLQYTTMAINGMRLCWLHRWHDLVAPGQIGRTFAFLWLTYKMFF